MSKFAEACRLSYLEWEATLPNIEDIPEPEYSKKHIKRMNRLFDQMRDDTYHHFTSRAVKIMVIAAVIAALTLTAFVIPSSREYLLNNFDVFGLYEMSEHNNNAVSGEIEVGYIPEGYELVKTDSRDKFIANVYETKEGQMLLISKNASTAGIALNTENGEVEKIVVNGITYMYNTNESDTHNIVWIENDYFYQIGGQVSKEELIRIAEGVK